MTLDLDTRATGGYPADLRGAAGVKIVKTGLRADLSLELRDVQKLPSAPTGGLVPVQDPMTGLVQALDLASLPTAQPGDGTVGNVKLAASPAQTIKGNTTNAVAQPQDVSLSTLAAPGNPIGDALAARVRATHTAAPDANYQALVTDVQIGFATLTASRTVTLPDVDVYPLGQALFIADESGQCSSTRPIIITVGSGTGDTIAGQPALQLTDAYQGIGLRRGAANVWIISR